nr:DUF6132 family protein [uncultured Fluviicola sp.]
MKRFLKNYRLGLIGVILGGVGGYAYYHFIGCSSGSCPITSKPVNSILYGSMMGFLLLSSFNVKSKKE